MHVINKRYLDVKVTPTAIENELRDALRDAATRLRSLAKSNELRCRCESLNNATYHCEPCRALAAADRFEAIATSHSGTGGS